MYCELVCTVIFVVFLLQVVLVLTSYDNIRARENKEKVVATAVAIAEEVVVVVLVFVRLLSII